MLFSPEKTKCPLDRVAQTLSYGGAFILMGEHHLFRHVLRFPDGYSKSGVSSGFINIGEQ